MQRSAKSVVERGMQTIQEIFEIPEHRKHLKKVKKQESVLISSCISEPLKNIKKRLCNDSSEDDDRYPPK
jgi:hypothetical protein